jgi:prepilin-type N-terminal cleavage/methylation domain-containing protein
MISKIRRSMASNEGFTLIELMIVVAIIGMWQCRISSATETGHGSQRRLLAQVPQGERLPLPPQMMPIPCSQPL